MPNLPPPTAEEVAKADAVPDPNTKPEDFQDNMMNSEEARRRFFAEYVNEREREDY